MTRTSTCTDSQCVLRSSLELNWKYFQKLSSSSSPTTFQTSPCIAASAAASAHYKNSSDNTARERQPSRSCAGIDDEMVIHSLRVANSFCRCGRHISSRAQCRRLRRRRNNKYVTRIRTYRRRFTGWTYQALRCPDEFGLRGCEQGLHFGRGDNSAEHSEVLDGSIQESLTRPIVSSQEVAGSQYGPGIETSYRSHLGAVDINCPSTGASGIQSPCHMVPRTTSIESERNFKQMIL